MMAEFQAARMGVGVPHILPFMKKAGFRTPQGEVGVPPVPTQRWASYLVRWDGKRRPA